MEGGTDFDSLPDDGDASGLASVLLGYADMRGASWALRVVGHRLVIGTRESVKVSRW